MQKQILINDKSHEDEIFKGISLPGDILIDKEFVDCKFIDCNFHGTCLRRLRLEEVVFENCDLSLSQLTGSQLLEVSFINCKLVGVNFTLCSSTRSLVFKNCKVDHSVFQEMDLNSTTFENCSLKHVDFSQSILRGANFTKSNLDEAFFSGADLTACDFRGARDYSIDPRYSKLKHAKFSSSDVLRLLHHLDIIIE
ncbi:MAG: pentapeptide repeat-containing protein [Bacteriovoracaceae bacterium]|nr:pentapeptide repeat-containing protein [Bacteriovoracaceae bacterium]